MDMTSITPQIPSKCHLWTKPELDINDFSTLKEVERYRDDGDWIRQMMKCSECGQHYYKEFYETDDWSGGGGQYRTYIPIKPTKKIIAQLNALNYLDIHTVSPRLLDDWQEGGGHNVRWVDRWLLSSNAKQLASKWHKGQTRKGDGQPYIIHPTAVAEMLKQHGFADETIAAGYCHDLLEDTGCTPAEILEKCGPKVLETVKSVTNDATLPWKEKKLKYIETVRIGSDDAKAVCVADKIHNLESLLQAHKKYGPSIWSKFNRCKKDKLWFEQGVLKMLQETWDHPLIAEYEKLIKKMEKLEDQGQTKAQQEASREIIQLMISNLRKASIEAEKDPVYQALTESSNKFDRECRAKGIGSGVYVKGKDIYLDEKAE